jgi:hypothetical protein
MRADNSHHIVTAARRRAAATRRRAIAALRRIDNAGQAISFDAVAREGKVSRSWPTPQVVGERVEHPERHHFGNHDLDGLGRLVAFLGVADRGPGGQRRGCRSRQFGGQVIAHLAGRAAAGENSVGTRAGPRSALGITRSRASSGAVIPGSCTSKTH